MHCKRFVSRATKALCLVSLSWLTIGSAVAATTTEQLWRNAQARTPPADAPQVSVYRLQLDLARLRAYVADTRGSGAAFELALPAPDGTFAQFLVADSGTMPAALQAKYPQIVSLAGGDAAGRKVRIDVSPSGVQQWCSTATAPGWCSPSRPARPIAT